MLEPISAFKSSKKWPTYESKQQQVGQTYIVLKLYLSNFYVCNRCVPVCY